MQWEEIWYHRRLECASVGKQERDYLQPRDLGRNHLGRNSLMHLQGWGQAAKSAEQNLGVLLDQNLPVEQPWDTAVTRAARGTAGKAGRGSFPAAQHCWGSPQIFTWTPSARETESKQQRISRAGNLAGIRHTGTLMRHHKIGIACEIMGQGPQNTLEGGAGGANHRIPEFPGLEGTQQGLSRPVLAVLRTPQQSHGLRTPQQCHGLRTH